MVSLVMSVRVSQIVAVGCAFLAVLWSTRRTPSTLSKDKPDAVLLVPCHYSCAALSFLQIHSYWLSFPHLDALAEHRDRCGRTLTKLNYTRSRLEPVISDYNQPLAIYQLALQDVGYELQHG